MEISINGATTMKATLHEDVTAASAAGFDAIEIWAAKLDTYLETHTLGELKSLVEEKGLRVASINSIEFITFRPPTEHESIVTRCRELCEAAQALDCDKIVVVPSPTPEDADWSFIRDESVRVLRELSDVAAPCGVRLAFEFLGFSWCSVRTLAQCWDIVTRTKRDHVGMVLDTCHFFAGGSELASIERVDPAKVLILHINDVEDRPAETIKDAHRLLPGEGIIPLDEILVRLERIGFDGLCSVELFRPEYWERDPTELARAAKAATLSVVGEHFTVG